MNLLERVLDMWSWRWVDKGEEWRWPKKKRTIKSFKAIGLRGKIIDGHHKTPIDYINVQEPSHLQCPARSKLGQTQTEKIGNDKALGICKMVILTTLHLLIQLREIQN